MKVLLSGMLAGDPYQGGASWAVLQYALGFERLGHDVFVVEPIDELQPETAAYFDAIVSEFGLRATLLPRGQPWPFPPEADVLVNISGLLRDGPLESVPIRIYLDLDPVFNQHWHLQGIDVGLGGHTHYASVGTEFPDCGLEWIATLPPVVLDRWPASERIEYDALTTVGNWRGYGSIEHNGIRYGQKAHSLRRFVDLPRRSGERFALALNIDPAETPDLEALAHNGWHLLDPRSVAGTPSAYASFVRGSRAEFGIAKEGYVVSRSGWFSDRSACYLASGRPVLAQDTGFGQRLPVGGGLFAFATGDDAEAAVEELRRDYARYSRSARAIAEEFLDSDVVLTRLLREVGALLQPSRRTIHEADAAELQQVLGGDVVSSRPFEYRSTAPIAEVVVRFADSSTEHVLVKDLARSTLTEPARRAKPAFLVDPLREIDVYCSLLDGADLGTPRLYGTSSDGPWLALEKVDGTELYQVGDVSTWQQALRWLAKMHDRFRGRRLPSRLLSYDRVFFERWLERARSISALDGLDHYELVVKRLVSLPRTLLHGEFYASNVLIDGERVCAVDWELAAQGPGAIDVAAITMGWGEDERRLLAATYWRELSEPPPFPEFEVDLDCARLHLAVQWLGWSADWSPPPQHAHDFRSEARMLAERVGA